MTHVTYRIVRHDDGWAYTADGVFSEPFPTHAQACARLLGFTATRYALGSLQSMLGICDVAMSPRTCNVG